MNTSKGLLSFGIFLLAIVSIVGYASALSFSAPSEITLSNNKTTLVLTNDNTVQQNVSLLITNIVSGSDQVQLSVNPSYITNLNAGAFTNVDASISNIIGNLEFGKYTATLSAHGVNSTSGESVSNVSSTITFSKTFCKKGSVGANLSLKNIDISNDGDDDEIWMPLDTVTIEVDVKNVGDDDVKDIFVEMALYDSSGSDSASDLDFSSADEEQYDLGDLNDGDTETATFEFQIPADFEEGNYKLAIKAYSDDDGEDKECIDTTSDLNKNTYQEIEIEAQDDEGKFIAFQDIEVTPTEVTCGESVRLTTNVYNIGDDEQDQVRINLYSNELGIDLSREIRNNLDKGDSEEVTFEFIIPSGAAEKNHYLELTADYDYRNSNYRESSDEPTREVVKVIGCTPAPSENTAKAGITATLSSEASAGKEMTVKATIKNIDSKTNSYVAGVSGYDSWATLSSVSSRIFDLAPGESKEITLTFNVNKDAVGEQTFTIETTSGSKVDSRQVSVNVAKSNSFGSFFEGSALIWAIAIVNIILIVLIIVVAVRLSRK